MGFYVLRVVLFHNLTHKLDVWHELDLLPSKNYSASRKADGTLRGCIFGRIAARNSATKFLIVSTSGRRIGQESAERAKRCILWFGEKPATATFEALRLSRCCMLHRGSAEHQLFPRLNDCRKLSTGAMGWAASLISDDSVRKCEICL